MSVSERWIKKYMRMAKAFGEDDNRCLSRSIGVVIVDPIANKLLSAGLNGPPRGTPQCDDEEYLAKVVRPQLTEKDTQNFVQYVLKNRENSTQLDTNEINDITNPITQCCAFQIAAGCKVCPRKMIGAKSGERLELCSCAHGETNAIVNAGCNLQGAWMFCWCGIPCIECTKLIINSGIKRVYALKDVEIGNVSSGAYKPNSSMFLFNRANVEVILCEEADMLSHL